MKLRHPHGRGLILEDAEANLATYISRDSTASGSAKLRDCRLEGDSHACNLAQIYGGRLIRTRVHGHTIIAGSPLIKSSIIGCNEVSGRAYLDTVVATGMTEICDAPTLIGGLCAPLVLHDAVIYGQPSIIGSFTVTGRVHEGTWARAPKHIELPWCDLSECVNGKILLQCYCRPAEWFLRFGYRLAAKWSWSDDMIAVTMDTIRREFLAQPRELNVDCRREPLPPTTASETPATLP